MKKKKEELTESEKALKEIKCTILGNPDWEKGQKILEEQVSKDISEGKIVLNSDDEQAEKIGA